MNGAAVISDLFNYAEIAYINAYNEVNDISKKENKKGKSKNERTYPIILTQDSREVLVEVPDMEILTQGKDFADAIEMARDAIGLKGIIMEDMWKIILPRLMVKSIDQTLIIVYHMKNLSILFR